MIASDLSKLFPVEGENPDHGEWDTDVVQGHPEYRLHMSCTIVEAGLLSNC